MDTPDLAATDLGPLEIHAASFLDVLGEEGYAPHRLTARRAALQEFTRWAEGNGLSFADVGEGHVSAFVMGLSRGRCTSPRLAA
jgi:site-specific recombinase XerD